MGAVDYTFYTTVYMGNEADETSFPALCARASDVVDAMIRYADTSVLPERIQTLYKKAICAQIDFFAINGLDVATAGTDRGFTVGKVSVNGKANALALSGKFADNVSPMVLVYLEQTGLLNPHVETWGW